jgi:acetylornithine/N-succinyldiaminopimelate aminotransferase
MEQFYTVHPEHKRRREMSSPFDAVMPVTPRPETVFVRGSGSWLEARGGRRYLDFIQGWAVNALGHSPAVIRDALLAQSQRLLNTGPAFYNEPMVALAQRLATHSVFDRVFFANSGAEANEGAIKLARKWGAKQKGGAYGIITMQNGFHGRTLATMSASGKPGWDKLFEPKVPGFTRVAFNDIAAVERAIDSNTVAVMLELVQGEGGVVVAEKAYLQQLRALTHKHNLLLIIDEVQTGMGRTGKLFAYEHYGIVPDIMTLGKGIGGGVPLSALLSSEAVSCFDYGDQGGTYNGNPLMSAVGCAVFDVVSDAEFLRTVAERGDHLRSGLERLAQQFGLGPVSGLGLLLALNTGSLSATGIVRRAFEEGLLLNAPRDDRLRFMPALNVSGAEIDEMLLRLEKLLPELTHDGSQV